MNYELLLIYTFTEYLRKNCKIGKTTLQPEMTTTTADIIFYMEDNSNSYSETGASFTAILVIALPAAVIGFVILLAVVTCLVWYKFKLRNRQQQSYAKPDKLIVESAMPLQGRL